MEHLRGIRKLKKEFVVEGVSSKSIKSDNYLFIPDIEYGTYSINILMFTVAKISTIKLFSKISSWNGMMI